MLNITLDGQIIDRSQEILRTSHAQTWINIPIDGLDVNSANLAHRLNALGSSFYFIKVVLRKHRLSNTFHRNYCAQFECENLLEVNEVPRDHFKTTIGAHGIPMWWALPFSAKDEAYMRALGYKDEWIRWMKRVHNPNTRTLICMEVIKNAWKVGKKIAGEYKSNDFFKALFSEILPDSSCQWSQDTMTHKRTNASGGNQGEGTYEFTGVDAALQSKHYDHLVFDDLYGKDALESESVAESTWEWFKLAAGAFDSITGRPDDLPDVVVNGNRWSYHDLNWKIKEANLGFRFHTHDAEGGCCELHPPNTPIFPEEFSMAKLARLKNWFGDYFYSCQFRNRPQPAGGQKFKTEWLRYFAYTTMENSSIIPPSPAQISKQTREASKNAIGLHPYYSVLARSDGSGRREGVRQYKAIRYEVVEGKTTKDIPTNSLIKAVWIDPNHKGELGRARHCVMATGMMKDPFRIHILEGWAEAVGREEAVQKMYELGERWKIRTVWTEIAAGQTWLKTLLEITNRNNKLLGKWYFDDTYGFRDNRNENAKDDRIEDTEPFFRRGEIFLCSQDPFTAKFKAEYEEYPRHATKDILDLMGHICQNIDINMMSEKDLRNLVTQQNTKWKQTQRSGMTGY